MMNEGIKDFKNWTEVINGIYRYVIAASVCYEIHIEHYVQYADILTDTKASLYIAGEWCSPETKNKEDNSIITPKFNYFERELLLKSASVQECLTAAIKDYNENITDSN